MKSLSLNPNEYPAQVWNSESREIPPYSALEVFDADDEALHIRRPTAASLGQLVFAHGGGIASDDTGTAHTKSGVQMAKYDADDGDPEVGDFIGSKADSYLLSVNGSGFLVLAVDKTNAIVYVRG